VLTREQAVAIRLEARRRKRDPDLLQNQEIHRRILATWERESPKMWASLTSAGVAQEAAFVAQQKMWEEMDNLLKAGMPVTDAREQAERQHLLLAPEADEAGAAEYRRMMTEPQEPMEPE
jgi:hypothetical protein